MIQMRGNVKPIGPNAASNIDPAQASAWLAHNNAHNRPLRPSHVAYLARQITNGNWILNGSTIVFDGNNLIDGQHRLAAIVLADKSVPMYVVVGTERDAYKTIDTGQMLRRGSDVTGLPEKVVSLVRRYNSAFSDTGRGKMSAQEIIDEYNNRRVHFDFAEAHHKHERIVGSISVWACFVLYHERCATKAQEFVSDYNKDIPEINQSGKLKAWLYRNFVGVKGAVLHHAMERVCYCLDAHYHGRYVERMSAYPLARAAEWVRP